MHPCGLACSRRESGARAVVNGVPARSDYAGCALIVASIALLPVGKLVHLPFASMAVAGIVAAVRSRGMAADPAARVLTLLYLCIWLPMLNASVDAHAPGRALQTTLAYLHFLPAAWYIAGVAGAPRSLEIVAAGSVAIAAVWLGDALLQAALGVNLLGYRYDGVVLKGVFHPGQLLGLVLAFLAPLYFEVLRCSRVRKPWAWLALAPLLVVLALTLKRSAWLMFVFAALGYAWVLGPRFMVSRRRWLASGAVAGAVLVALIGWQQPAFQARMRTATALATADFDAIDRASSYRLSLWRTGVHMFEHHWVNGIGPRGYRYAYPQYAGADDFWIARYGRGQTHPHFMLLEIAVEAGVVGLIGIAGFWWLLIRLLGQTRIAHPLGAVFLLCAALAWLPFNVHKAFYDSWWASLGWWALALGVGAWRSGRGEGRGG
jgi:O-antigen ligase